jgi:glucosylceramidase
VAPVIVDPDKDEIYLTPIYYILSHFSKFIRPGAEVIGLENSDKELQVTAAKNRDGSIAVVVFNPTEKRKYFGLALADNRKDISIDGKAIQTVVINK